MNISNKPDLCPAKKHICIVKHTNREIEPPTTESILSKTKHCEAKLQIVIKPCLIQNKWKHYKSITWENLMELNMLFPYAKILHKMGRRTIFLIKKYTYMEAMKCIKNVVHVGFFLYIRLSMTHRKIKVGRIWINKTTKICFSVMIFNALRISFLMTQTNLFLYVNMFDYFFIEQC